VAIQPLLSRREWTPRASSTAARKEENSAEPFPSEMRPGCPRGVQRKGKNIPCLIFPLQKTPVFSSYQRKVIHNLLVRCADFAHYSRGFDTQPPFWSEKYSDF
ncbi:MAG: hypothetical protein ABSC42_18170, partial [Tepidisphaeraceae bacterium]